MRTLDAGRVIPVPGTLPAGMTIAGLVAVPAAAGRPEIWGHEYRRTATPATDDLGLTGVQEPHAVAIQPGARATTVKGSPGQLVGGGSRMVLIWRQDGMNIELSTDRAADTSTSGATAAHLMAVAATVHVNPISGPTLPATAGWVAYGSIRGHGFVGLSTDVALESGASLVLSRRLGRRARRRRLLRPFDPLSGRG